MGVDRKEVGRYRSIVHIVMYSEMSGAWNAYLAPGETRISTFGTTAEAKAFCTATEVIFREPKSAVLACVTVLAENIFLQRKNGF